MEMRKVFAAEIDNIMENNSNVVLINADLALELQNKTWRVLRQE